MAEQLIGSPHVNTGGPCPSCGTAEGRMCSCEPGDELAGLMRELSNVATYAEAGVDVLEDKGRGLLVLRALVLIGARLKTLEGRIGRLESCGGSRLKIDPRARARASWVNWDAEELERELAAIPDDDPHLCVCCSCGQTVRCLRLQDRPDRCPACESMKLI